MGLSPAEVSAVFGAVSRRRQEAPGGGASLRRLSQLLQRVCDGAGDAPAGEGVQRILWCWTFSFNAQPSKYVWTCVSFQVTGSICGCTSGDFVCDCRCGGVLGERRGGGRLAGGTARAAARLVGSSNRRRRGRAATAGAGALRAPLPGHQWLRVSGRHFNWLEGRCSRMSSGIAGHQAPNKCAIKYDADGY